MLTKTLLRILFLVLICFYSLIIAQAQIDKSTPADNVQKDQSKVIQFDSPTDPIPCEQWILYVAEAAREWHRQWETDNNSTLIIIARAGDKESHKTNLKRIKTLKENSIIPKLKIKVVFAEGERVEGKGVIEFYVAGKLFISIPLFKNEDIPLTYCIP